MLLRRNVLLPRHNAHSQSDVRILSELVHSVVQPVEQLLVIVGVFAVKREPVSAYSRGDAVGFADIGADLISDCAENQISEIASLHCVYIVEALDIYQNRVHRAVGMLAVEAFDIRKEVVSRIKPRERVGFGRSDKLLPFLRLLLSFYAPEDQSHNYQGDRGGDREYHCHMLL